MTTKEISRILTTITEEQWEAILTSANHVTNLPFVQKLSNFDASYNKENKKVLSKDEFEIKIENLLNKLGVPSHILGYKYIKDALILAYVDETYIKHGKITKTLYPLIAERNETTVSRVDRAIGHSIKKVYDKGNFERYGVIEGKRERRPANSEAIAAIYQYLRLRN